MKGSFGKAARFSPSRPTSESAYGLMNSENRPNGAQPNILLVAKARHDKNNSSAAVVIRKTNVVTGNSDKSPTFSRRSEKSGQANSSKLITAQNGDNNSNNNELFVKVEVHDLPVKKIN